MERIIRSNAVKNLCHSGILGMNQHSLHPSENLAPQNITICGVSFAPSIGVSLNAPNVKCNNLLALSAEIANTQRNGALLQGLLSQVLKALL